MRTTRFRWLFLGVATVVIVAATLLPGEPRATTGIYWQLRGLRSLADGLANILLFVPFGAIAAWSFRRWSRAVAAGALLSFLIELTQFIVPGRYSSPFDLAFNTVGAALGVAVVHTSGVWLRPGPRTRIMFGALSLLAAVGVLAGGSALLSPSARSSGDTYVEWTPELQNERYLGHVINATLGDRSLDPGRTAEWKDLLHALHGTDTLRIRLITGAPPPRGAAIFRIVDRNSTELLVLSARGNDLLLRYRARAAVVHLDQPEVRVPAGLADVPEGREVVIRVWRSGVSDCVSARITIVCSGRTMGETWALLLFPVPGMLESSVTVLWIAALLLPAGFWIARRSVFIAAAVSVLLVLTAGPVILPVLPTPPAQLFAALAGLVGGHAIGRRRGAPAPGVATGRQERSPT